MTSLDRGHRRALEQTVRKARRIAEAGSRQGLEHLAVAHHEPRGHLSADQRTLRNRLRARARQLGDKRDARGAQQIDRLIEQCAYEHWHRMLFSRFLAENDLLIEPASGVPISLTDCRELAAEQGRPWIELASEYAVLMLSQVFRRDDAVLELHLPAERSAELDALLEALPVDVFTATDSLGWTYQFWQADAKDAVNASEVKIGARELAPVTQLFTEDYMVDFLLHNTLGAWWAGKLGPIFASSEADARTRAALPARDGLPAVEWRYLRFVAGDVGTWQPAAGTFDGWPKTAREITVLDPCMGSGHFLVFALPLLARLRMEEERLSGVDAVDYVLRENLFGLELEDRCTQIAAFNLALSAWRAGGYRVLPQLNLACSGLSISVSEEEWVALAGSDTARAGEMKALYQAFKNAPLLGSLINPRSIVRSTWADTRGGRDQGALFEAGPQSLASLLARAVDRQTRDEAFHELAVTARGIAKAAQILGAEFTLVATNVPYLGRGKQSDELKDYAERHHARAKADLATCFVERCLAFCDAAGSAALVTPQIWLFLGGYRGLRENLLDSHAWRCVVRLGSGAFETIGGAVVNAALFVLQDSHPNSESRIAALDVSNIEGASGKGAAIPCAGVAMVPQRGQRLNPDARVTLSDHVAFAPLGAFAGSTEGLSTGDRDRFIRKFWELYSIDNDWAFFQTAPTANGRTDGCSEVVYWQSGRGVLSTYTGARIQGHAAWGRPGILVGRMSKIRGGYYAGNLYDKSCVVLTPKREDYLLPLYAFCMSPDFEIEIRRLDKKLGVATSVPLKVPFDLEAWEAAAGHQYPDGAPGPESNDPRQWFFQGHPIGAEAETVHQVAVARLLAYRWPSELDETICLGNRPGQPVGESAQLQEFADKDGIVCLPALQHEQPAARRLRALLAGAFGNDWSAAKERDLLAAAGSLASRVEDWVEGEFFEQHSALFDQRPFVWHIWDGRRDGFSALVNYHRLAGPDGEGRRTLDKLTHTYLGDWITRQRSAVAANEEGAEARLAAAEHLRDQLLKILGGEPPFDIFVRWKPLHEQPIGWEPDINDGVRINIRPFMMAKPLNARGKNACILRATPKIKWDKDRGKEPERPREGYPWFWGWDGRTQDFEGGREFDGIRWNDLHYTRARKERARREHVATEEATR